MTSIKMLNVVLRDSKLYAQTKALYSYLWIRADYKSGLSYPPKAQTLTELNLTENLYNQGLQVLINRGYIKPTTKEQKDKEGKKYTINCYDIIGDAEYNKSADKSDADTTKTSDKTSNQSK